MLTVVAPGRDARARRRQARCPASSSGSTAPDERGVGEVLARGPNVMVGYTDEAATREAIDAEGWLHTGDLGKLDKKGRLVIVGRAKDVVVSPSGENVYPDDVERRLGEVAARRASSRSSASRSAAASASRASPSAEPSADGTA